MASGLPARVVVVCALIALAPIAHAQRTERRPVAVIDLVGESSDERGQVAPAEALANDLYRVLVNHTDLQPVNPGFIRSLKGPFPDEERTFLDTANRSKKEVDEFLGLLDHRSVELAAARGMEALLNMRPSPDVLGLYAELAFAGGLAALKQRKPNDASLAFGLSYRLDPAKRPDPTRYEPDVVEAYELASKKPPVAAKLEVKGAGTVWIDGVDRGPPGTFDVSSGLHLVQLSGPERETRGRQVNVPEVSALEIEAAPASEERKIERARIELARTRDAAARAGGVKKLAQLLGVGDAVLIEKAENGALLVQTWRNREPGFSKPVEHKEEQPGQLLVPLAPPRKPDPPKPDVIPLPPPIVETPIYKRRWFQGAVATGILAIAATIYIVATQDRMQGFDGDIKPEGE